MIERSWNLILLLQLKLMLLLILNLMIFYLFLFLLLFIRLFLLNFRIWLNIIDKRLLILLQLHQLRCSL